MTGTPALRVTRLIRETAGFLLPLTETGRDAAVTRVDFDFDLRPGADLTGAVILCAEAVGRPGELDRIRHQYASCAALVVAPGTHAHLDDDSGSGRPAGSGADHWADSGSAGTAGPLVLERSEQVTWSEVLVQLRQLNEGAASALTWPDTDDLGSLAAVIADLTGASITIEDPASRVLAHANLGEDIDEIRRQTILTGAIPRWRIEELEESGFLPAIRESTDVVERPATEAEPARSVIALRSEGELLGTIWAAHPEAADPDRIREVLRDAARAALPVMLRTLRRSPFEKRIRREALASILQGASDLGPAATLLALPFAGHYAAIAIAEVTPEREPELRFHLRAAFADAVIAHEETTGLVAVLVQTETEVDPEDLLEAVAAALARTRPAVDPLMFGLGVMVGRLDQVHLSWSEAEYVCEAVRQRLEEANRPAGDDGVSGWLEVAPGVFGAIAAEVPAELMGLMVADALTEADERLTAPARILALHDERHEGRLLETLRAYFDAVGNSAEASRRLHVHSNSLRHRLTRIEELTGLSPLDRAQRLWLELSVLVHDRNRR